MAHRLCARVRRALRPSESPTWCGGYEDKFEGGRDGGQNKRVFVLQEKTHYLNIIHDKAETREAVHTCRNIPPPLGKKRRGRVKGAFRRRESSPDLQQHSSGWCAPRTKCEFLSNTDAGSGGALNMTSKAAVLFYVHRNVQECYSAAWEPGWEGEGRSLNLTKSRMSEVSVPWQLLNSWVKPTKKSATKRLVGRRESNPDLSQFSASVRHAPRPIHCRPWGSGYGKDFQEGKRFKRMVNQGDARVGWPVFADQAMTKPISAHLSVLAFRRQPVQKATMFWPDAPQLPTSLDLKKCRRSFSPVCRTFDQLQPTPNFTWIPIPLVESASKTPRGQLGTPKDDRAPLDARERMGRGHERHPRRARNAHGSVPGGFPAS
ncbi:hypothetical protein C8R47DRAFT_1082238 [Mycena vitilis]|nr:hypothetical protein C8R47DRAFT_1082238 [Mycena vitilis]